MKYAQEFTEKTQQLISEQQNRRNTIRQNLNRQEEAKLRSQQQYQDYELARSRAAYLKTQTMERLDEYLLSFEQQFTQKGGKIIWAEDASQVQNAVLDILQNEGLKEVVAGKSVIAEELGLYAALANKGIHLKYSSLEDSLLRLKQGKRYHMNSPLLHLSADEIHNSPAHLSEESADKKGILSVLSKDLRKIYRPSQVNICEADFLVADAGGISISENEGDTSMASAFSKIQIVLAGIERVLPSLDDLDLFWSLLAHNRSAQVLCNYNTLYLSPKRPEEQDGAELLYLILVDNGRSDLLANPSKRQSLNCIRCGACESVCPVLQQVGESPYQNTYAGPIGAVITPQVKGLKDFQHLSQASTLCGACKSVCPVKIDLPKLLLENRRQAVEESKVSRQEKSKVAWWRYLMSSANNFSLWRKRFSHLVLGQFSRTPSSASPKAAQQSFSKQWKKQQKNKSS